MSPASLAWLALGRSLFQMVSPVVLLSTLILCIIKKSGVSLCIQCGASRLDLTFWIYSLEPSSPHYVHTDWLQFSLSGFHKRFLNGLILSLFSPMSQGDLTIMQASSWTNSTQSLIVATYPAANKSPKDSSVPLFWAAASCYLIPCHSVLSLAATPVSLPMYQHSQAHSAPSAWKMSLFKAVFLSAFCFSVSFCLRCLFLVRSFLISLFKKCKHLPRVLCAHFIGWHSKHTANWEAWDVFVW